MRSGLAWVLEDIAKERNRQDDKWGVQEHDMLYWLGILMEEVGEVAKAIIETPKGKTYPTPLIDAEKWMDEIRDELIQVAAVAAAAVENIDRGRARERVLAASVGEARLPDGLA